MNSAAYSSWDPGRLLGSIVDERWRLESSLAAIEGAAFYSGVEIGSGRPVMLEVTAAIPVSRLRQLRRPELLGAISHPSVLEVLEVGATIEGLHYAVMERAEGEPLSTLLVRQGRLAPEQAAKIAVSLATALQGIHAAGSVHGQLHPARVFVGEHGRVQLSLGLHQPQVLELSSDGTAQLIVSRHPAFDWNDVARAVVTPVPYCAPEQLLRHPLDARMDIYSLGALLYEMLHGTPPHACATVAGFAAARLAFPPSPLGDDVPAALRKEVERALAKSPSVRHPSARALSIALEESMLSLVRGPTEVLATETQRLGDWTLVRRIRETNAGTHWNTADGFLLVERPAEMSDTRAAARIQAAQAFAGISHPGIARIVDSMGAGEISYVVLDAPKGVTLRELEEKMSVSTDILSRIALDALEAIECAHAHGAVFGDLDSDSVLVTKRGEVVVLPTCSDGDTFRAEDDVVALGKLAKIEVPPHTLQLLAKRLRSTVSVADRELVGRFVTLADASVSPPSVSTPLGTLPKPPPSPASVKSTPLPPPPQRIYEHSWHDLVVSESAISINGAPPAHLYDTERPVVSEPDIIDSITRSAAKLRRAPVMAMATMCVACALVGYVLWPGASTVGPGAAPPAQRTEDRKAAPEKSRAPARLQPTAREAQAQRAPPAKHENVVAPAATSLLPKRAPRARSDSAPSAPERKLRGDGGAHAPSVEADAINYRPTSL